MPGQISLCCYLLAHTESQAHLLDMRQSSFSLLIAKLENVGGSKMQMERVL